MDRNEQRSFSIAMLALLLITAAAAQAGPLLPPTYQIELKPGQFGQLDKADTDCPAQGCGPVAAVDSFVWLQNQWPDVYGKKLLFDGDEKKTANSLAAPAYMNTRCTFICPRGTYWEEFLLGKAKWIEDKVAGKTAYAAQTKFEWGTNDTLPDDRKDKKVLEDVSGNVSLTEKQNPAWDFIYYSLRAAKDVEILITFDDDTGHYLTLYSFNWTDKDMDGVVDKEEGALIGFVDSTPDGLTMLGEGLLWQVGKDEPLNMRYTREKATRDAEITFAVREAAVSEPGIAALVVAGLFALAGIRRREAVRRCRHN